MPTGPNSVGFWIGKKEKNMEMFEVQGPPRWNQLRVWDGKRWVNIEGYDWHYQLWAGPFLP